MTNFLKIIGIEEKYWVFPVVLELILPKIQVFCNEK